MGWKQGRSWNSTTGKWDNEVTEPKEFKDSGKLSLVLYSKQWLQNITAKCIEAAGASEFQIGYRALIVRLTKGETQFIVTLPTATYNFPQEVSGARVDYELEDVEKFGKQVSEDSMKGVSEIIGKMPVLDALNAVAEANGFEYEIFESNCGSIHRHPGDFGFSSTDYDKDPEHPGVIFRMGNVKNHAQTDSVLYIQPNGQTKIVVTETRIVNVEPHTDGGIDGTYDEIPTICMVMDDVKFVNQFDELLGEGIAKKELYSLKKTLNADHTRPVIQMLIDAYRQIEYVPTVDGVEAENIEQKSYAAKKTTSGVHSGTTSGTKKKTTSTTVNQKQQTPTAMNSTKKNNTLEASLETSTNNTTTNAEYLKNRINPECDENGEKDVDWLNHFDSLDEEDQQIAILWIESYTQDPEYTHDEAREWCEYIKQNIMEEKA